MNHNRSAALERSVKNYWKADWTAFKTFAKDKCEELLKDHMSSTDLEGWSSFKSVIHNGIAKFRPMSARRC